MITIPLPQSSENYSIIYVCVCVCVCVCVYWLCRKYLDLHWTLTVTVQYQSDHVLRLYVEVCPLTRRSTQVFIVDYNNIEILRILSSIHTLKQIKYYARYKFKTFS